MSRTFRGSMILACLLVALASAALQAQQGRTFVEFIPTSAIAVAPGHSQPVSFTFRVQQGYHINSNTPSAEELIPTQLHFTLPGELTIGKVQYPAGQLVSFPFDPTHKLSVYSGDVIIRALVIAPENSAPGPLTVHAEFKYQACDNNACYPPKKLPISFNVRITENDRKRPGRELHEPHAH